MSWFSNRFPQDHGAGEEEEGSDAEDQIHGKGVTEDLSLLTKSFTQQLWGVASFLAPPPQNRNGEGITAKSTGESLDSSASSSDRRPQSPPPGDPPFSNELVDVDFKGSVRENRDEAEAEGFQGEKRKLLPSQSSEDVLAGIGKDLAELKGSVATGLSRILKVVREEIERDDDLATHPNEIEGVNDDDDENNDENTVKPESSSIKFSGFNALFRPLLSSILLDDKMVDLNSDAEEEEEGREDDQSDVHDHEVSHSSLDYGVSGIAKFASSLFPVNLDSDDDKDMLQKRNLQQPVGVTDEVLTFAGNISMHPETWLDFPLFTEEEDDDGMFLCPLLVLARNFLIARGIPLIFTPE
jgi:hypothetical protein